MSFLNHVGQYQGSDGFQAMLAAEGFDATRRHYSEAHERRVDNFAAMLADVMMGRTDSDLLKEAFNPRHGYKVEELQRRYPGVLQLRETMTTTDFAQYLTVDVLQRTLFGMWNVTPINNMPMVYKRTLNDFRTVKDFAIDGGTKPFSKNYPGKMPDQRVLTPVTPITWAPDLYDGYMSINWRAIVNDDMGIFNDLLKRLMISGNRTIQLAITNLYCDVNGPHASLYKTANKNQIITANGAGSNNPALSFQGIMDGRTVLRKQLDADGYPIELTGSVILWYGPDLETTAMSLMKAAQADISVGGGTTNAQGFPSQRLRVDNWVVNGLTPLCDTFIPLVTTAGTAASKMWGLMYDPNTVARPALEFGFLKGFENGPQLFQRAPDTMRAGGGIDATLGSFNTMDIDYKGVTVFGSSIGVADGPKSTVASNGSGT